MGMFGEWFNQPKEYEAAGFDNYGDYWWDIKPEKFEYDTEEEYEQAHSIWQSKKPLSGSWFGGY
jgi:hypothetical protein